MGYRPQVAVSPACVLLLLLAAAGPSAGADEEGERLYRQYCASCHGRQAKGDGDVAASMRIKPPDLTQLAARNGGEFPLELVVKKIDGREIPRAHGSPAMPVWGDVLAGKVTDGRPSSVPVERRVQARILSIADYLRMIQGK
jgi:mono/diheme cytochrome c family protein